VQPENFERAMQNYDPALTLRWGHVIKSWVVERRCAVSPALMATLVNGMQKAIAIMHRPGLDEKQRYMLQKACEEGYSAGYGKRAVIYAKALDNRVFDALRLTDLQATGNMKRAIEGSVNREEKRVRDRHEEYEPLGREVISVMDWATRKHSAEVEHGKAPKLMAEAFKREAPKGTKQTYDQMPGLLDAQGVALGGSKKPVKIELAAR